MFQLYRGDQFYWWWTKQSKLFQLSNGNMCLKNVLPVYFQYSMSDPYVSNNKPQLSGNNSSVLH